MTGNDHNHDALVAALCQPALPAEQVGEKAAVAAMIEAQTRIPAASKRPRSRRGVAIAAVTVASLGLGGLAAAGPGIFLPAADRPDPPATPPTSVPATTAADDEGEPGDDVAPISTPADEVRDNIDGDVAACADATASSLVDAASDCETKLGVDKTDRARQTDADATTDGGVQPGSSANAPGQSGATPGQSGATPGQSDADPPGRSGATPGQTGATPGQTGATPGQSGATPGQSDADPPGRSGATPGQSDDAPEQSGPGRSGKDERP